MEITTQDIDNWRKANDEAGRLKEVIVDRIDEIINVLYETFNVKKRKDFYWFFYGAEEGQVGEINICGGSIFYESVGSVLPNDYSRQFPEEFLTMANDDIVSFIKSEMKEIQAAEDKKKAAAKLAKEKREAKKAAVVSKLSYKLV